ncbi:hypothetical protein [Thiothrix subterranea]|uniref:Uncharacterized protein n=1 Tax=Thiothrix subterranea TaxID=2735563 RepID=A0AA51MN88_9GAMM|nr:hypothetical protein [Thiothrix subterranea]MDQ5770488.1 hypothetical protein [Thiothrix subterranea]WML86834.1 hypothetical protein RCG00_21450 [Thiothrix subterranea]
MSPEIITLLGQLKRSGASTLSILAKGATNDYCTDLRKQEMLTTIMLILDELDVIRTGLKREMEGNTHG